MATNLDFLKNVVWDITEEGRISLNVNGTIYTAEEAENILENKPSNFVVSSDSLDVV